MAIAGFGPAWFWRVVLVYQVMRAGRYKTDRYQQKDCLFKDFSHGKDCFIRNFIGICMVISMGCPSL